MKNKVDFIKVIFGVVLFIVALLLAYDASNTRQKITYQSRASQCSNTSTGYYEFGKDNRVYMENCTAQTKTVTCTFSQHHCDSKDGDSGRSGQCSSNETSRTQKFTIPAMGEAVTDAVGSCNPGSCGSCQDDVKCESASSGIFQSAGKSCGGGSNPKPTPTPTKAVAPTIPPKPPTGSVSVNPAVICVNKPVAISGIANPNGTLQQTEIHIAKTDGKEFVGCPGGFNKDGFGNSFCLLTRATITNPAGTWTPQQAGNYKAVINVFNTAGGKCGGNPFVTLWPSPGGFDFCGDNSRKDITVLAATNPSCTAINSPTNTPVPPRATLTPVPTVPGLRSCNNTCTADSQCSSGYCFNGACRNPSCANNTNCTCDIAQIPTPTSTPIPTSTPVPPTPTLVPGKLACSGSCTKDSDCATNFCDNDAGMCRNRACQFETDCSCSLIPTSTPVPSPTTVFIAVNNNPTARPPAAAPSIPSAGMPSAKWGFLAIPAALLLLGLIL